MAVLGEKRPDPLGFRDSQAELGSSVKSGEMTTHLLGDK